MSLSVKISMKENTGGKDIFSFSVRRQHLNRIKFHADELECENQHEREYRGGAIHFSLSVRISTC